MNDHLKPAWEVPKVFTAMTVAFIGLARIEYETGLYTDAVVALGMALGTIMAVGFMDRVVLLIVRFIIWRRSRRER